MFRKKYRPLTELGDYDARRIALIKPSALGDIIHSLPVLTALRRRFPAAHITWVVNKGYEPLLRGHPDLDATLPFDRGIFRTGLLNASLAYSRFLSQFRRFRFDLVIDLQGLLRSALMVAASGAARRVGLNTAREGAPWSYTDVIRVADFNAIHAVDRYWLIAEALGVGTSPKLFRFPPMEGEHRWTEELLSNQPRPWLMVGVGSRWHTKRWPPQHFATLIRMAQDRYSGTAVFIGSGDEERLSLATAEKLSGRTLHLTGRTSLPQLAALLAKSDVMIANDTGPLHLAAALGRPVVAPYTCTSVLLNGPYGAESGTAETTVHCQGSYLKRCDRMICMDELTPVRLWPILQGVLLAWEKNRLSA